jgi:hypothetical protein
MTEKRDRIKAEIVYTVDSRCLLLHKFCVLLTSALDGNVWSASRLGRFIPGTHWTGGWVGPRTGLDEVEKRKILPIPGLVLRRIYTATNPHVFMAQCSISYAKGQRYLLHKFCDKYEHFL